MSQSGNYSRGRGGFYNNRRPRPKNTQQQQQQSQGMENIETKPAQNMSRRRTRFKPQTQQSGKSFINKMEVTNKSARVFSDVFHKEVSASPHLKFRNSETINNFEDDDDDDSSSVYSSTYDLSQSGDTFLGLSQASCSDSFYNLSQQDYSSTGKSRQKPGTKLPFFPHYPKCAIFWDIENCPLPSGKSALHFVKHMREKFCKNHTEDKFLVVCDTTKLAAGVSSDLQNSLVKLEHVSGTSKNAADECLRRNMREFAENNVAPSKIVIITGDINFNSELHDMKYKRHFNVILIHNRQTSEVLKALASECHEFEKFCRDLPEPQANQNTGSVVGIVKNLPTNVERGKIYGRLHRMVKIFGGKILNINDSSNSARVQFPSRNDALRAKSSLSGQDVQGSKITLDVITKNTERNNTDDDKKSKKKINENKNKGKEEPIQNTEAEQKRNPCFVSFCLNESMSFNQLRSAIQKQIDKVVSLELHSKEGIKDCYLIKCESLNWGRKMVKSLNQMKNPQLYDVQLLRNKSDAGMPNTSVIKENTVLENCVRIQQSYLDKHKTKMVALRKRLLDLNSVTSLDNLSTSNEIVFLQKRYNILFDIEKEFQQATNGILDSLKNGRKVNDPESKILFEASHLSRACPVYAYRSKIIKSFTVNPVTVLTGISGCGKSTQVVQYIFQEMITNKWKIVCTQPHKSLVTKVGSSVASQMKNSISYKLSPGNDQKLLYVTEHSLFLECFSNNLLDGITHILIDEAQERTIYTEFLLAYFKMILQKRKDLHLLVMTTPDCAESFSNFFNKCEIIKIDYANYPVEIIWEVPNQNYVKAAVAKALRILQSEENGDILVFLPNASDVNYASHVTAKTLGTLLAVNIYKLLLSYNFEQTYKNIQQSSSRNIIFTTGEEEKVISLPNVRFVVDTGFTTECLYEINHKFIETKFITLSSTEFRASAAGVNSPGKCYRLYSLEKLSSIHEESAGKRGIDLLVLRSLSLGLNPNLFDYFSPLSKEKISDSLKKLEKINAIESNVITRKGRQLIQLPLDIHLSNILLEGIAKKIGYETLCFAAVSSTMHMYTVLTTETSNIKMKNIMELMKDYMEWYGKNLVERENFLTEIKINVRSTMDIINEKLIQLHSVLKDSITTFRLQNTNSDWEFQLEKLIATCWLDNLCILQRPCDNVYLWNLQRKSVNLLPSLASKDDCPPCLIYETLWKMRSGEYITNIVPLDENVLENDENIRMVNRMKKMIQQDVTIIRPVGHYILKAGFVGSNGDLKVILEKKLSQLVGSTINIAVFQNKGEIKIYCGEQDKEKVRDEIGKTIENIQNKMKKELWEFCICKQTGMRIVWGKMAEIVQFLMPSDFMTVIAFSPTTTSTDKILQSFSKHGEIVHHSEKIAKTNKKQINIMFNNPTSAKHALGHKEKGITTKPRLLHLSQQNKTQYFVELKIHWTRRLNLGTATIQFDKCPSFIHEKIQCFPDIMKEYNEQGRRLVLKNLDRRLSKEEVVSKIEADLIYTDVKIENFHLLQEPGFQSTSEDLNVIKSKLRSLVTPILGKKNVEIVVAEPNLKDDTWTATVSSSNFQMSHLSINSICDMTLDGLPLRVTVNYSCCVFCGRDVFETVKNDFQVGLEKRRTIAELKNCNMQVKTTTVENNRKIAVEIIGDDLGEVILWYQCLASRLRSYTFNVSDYELLTEKFSDDDERQEILDKFAKNANAFVGYNKFSNQISVVENAEVIENLRSQLQLEIANSEFLDEAVFNCNSPGTIRELVKLYDPKLSVLKKITGAFHVELNITSKHIKVKGDDEAVNKIEDILKSIALKLKNIKASNIKIDVCPICSDDVENADYNYRMEICGHAYCFPCVTTLIANSYPPIFCLFKGCSKPIVFRDLSNLHQECPLVVRNLADKTTFRYLKRNMAAFLFCVLPDCDGILYRSDKENYCVKCFNKICIRCEVLYHYGETCEEYKKKYPKIIIQKSQVEFDANPSTSWTSVTAEKPKETNSFDAIISQVEFDANPSTLWSNVTAEEPKETNSFDAIISQIEFGTVPSTSGTSVTGEKPKETNSFETIQPISGSKSKLAIVFPTFSPEDSTTEAPIEKNTFIKSNTKPLSNDPELHSSSIFTGENSNSSLKSTPENNSQIEKQTAPKKLPPVYELDNFLHTGDKTPQSIPSFTDCSNRPQLPVHELDKTLSTVDKTPQLIPSFVGSSNKPQPPVYELSNSLSTGGETPQFTPSGQDWSSRPPPPVYELGNSLNTVDKTPQPTPSFVGSSNRPQPPVYELSSSLSTGGETPQSIPSFPDWSSRPPPPVYELGNSLNTVDKTPQPTPSFVGSSNRPQPPVYELSSSLSTGGETPQSIPSFPDWSSRPPPPVYELGNSLNTGVKTPQPVPSFASGGNRPTSSTGFLSSSSSGVGYSRSNEASRTPGINSTSYSSNVRSPSGNSYDANSTRVNYSNQRSDPNQFYKPKPPKNDDKCTTM